MRTRAFSRSTTDVTIVSGIPDGVFTASAVSSVVTASIGVCPANHFSLNPAGQLTTTANDPAVACSTTVLIRKRWPSADTSNE